MREKRTKIWIDRFQTFLSLRIACYFLIYQAAVWALVVLERTISQGLARLLSPGAVFSCSALLVATIVLLGFLFIRDCVKLAHRFVGPLYRFRKTIKAIIAGEELELIRLRQGDYLQELKDDLNEMLTVLEQRGAITLKQSQTEPTQDPVGELTNHSSPAKSLL